MFYYSFYTSLARTPECLVYRTDDGWNPDEKLAKQFETKQEAVSDSMKLQMDNEDFSFGKYVEIKSKNSRVPQKNKSKSNIKIVPADFQLDINKTYHMDCITFMEQIPGAYFDHVITSPPYNVGIRHVGSALFNMYDEYSDDMTEEGYEDWLFNVIDELLRTTKQHVFFNVQMLGKNKETILRLQGKYAKQIKDVMIWKKSVAAPHIIPGVMNSKFEYIFILSNDRPHMKNFLSANWSQGTFANVIEGNNNSQNKMTHLNRAAFPLYLPRIILKNFCKPGELIYDPFNGTGTTAEACAMEGFNYIGTDIDEQQLQETLKRYSNRKSMQELPFI